MKINFFLLNQPGSALLFATKNSKYAPFWNPFSVQSLSYADLIQSSLRTDHVLTLFLKALWDQACS